MRAKSTWATSISASISASAPIAISSLISTAIFFNYALAAIADPAKNSKSTPTQTAAFNVASSPIASAQAGSAQTTTTETTSKEVITTSKKRPLIGLALGGGGSRGSAHVGVLKVLVEEGVPIDLIAGTSIGSVVGGFYSAGVSLDALSNQFEKDTFIKEFMPMPLSLRLALEPILFIPRLLGYHPYDGLYKGKKFRNYADKTAGSPLIQNLHIPFAAVCTNVVLGTSWSLKEGDLGTAMQASTAVPGLKKPVQIGDTLFCDGGLVCNLPVSHVRDMGADFVIAVDIDEYLTEVPLTTFRRIGSVSTQALKIQLAQQDALQSKKADILIHPNTTGITLISRKKSDASRGIDAGVAAAKAAMPEIKRKLLALGVTLPVNNQTAK